MGVDIVQGETVSDAARRLYPDDTDDTRRLAFDVWASPAGGRSAVKAARVLSELHGVEVKANTLNQWANRHAWHEAASAAYLSSDPRRMAAAASIMVDGAPAMAAYLVAVGSGEVVGDRVAVTAAISGLQLVLGPATARRDNAADTIRSVVDVDDFQRLPADKLRAIAAGELHGDPE